MSRRTSQHEPYCDLEIDVRRAIRFVTSIAASLLCSPLRKSEWMLSRFRISVCNENVSQVCPKYSFLIIDNLRLDFSIRFLPKESAWFRVRQRNRDLEPVAKIKPVQHLPSPFGSSSSGENFLEFVIITRELKQTIQVLVFPQVSCSLLFGHGEDRVWQR